MLVWVCDGRIQITTLCWRFGVHQHFVYLTNFTQSCREQEHWPLFLFFFTVRTEKREVKMAILTALLSHPANYLPFVFIFIYILSSFAMLLTPFSIFSPRSISTCLSQLPLLWHCSAVFECTHTPTHTHVRAHTQRQRERGSEGESSVAWRTDCRSMHQRWPGCSGPSGRGANHSSHALDLFLFIFFLP